MELYGDAKDYKTAKCLVTSAFAQLSLTCKPANQLTEPTDALTLPCLKQADHQFLSQSNAVLRFLANQSSESSAENLYAANDRPQIDQWLDIAWSKLEIPLAAWFEKKNSGVEEKAKKDVEEMLSLLEESLSTKSYLIVEDKVTLADIAIVCGLYRYFLRFEKEMKESKPRVHDWMKRCVAQQPFQTHLVEPMATNKKKPQQQQKKKQQQQKKKASSPAEETAVSETPATTTKTASELSTDPTAASLLSKQTVLPVNLYSRHRVRVKEVLGFGLSTLLNETITVKGWAKTLREGGAGSFAFLELNDGSCFTGVQVIVSKDTTKGFEDVLTSGGVGASFSVTGILVESPAKGQAVEIKALEVKVYGKVLDKAHYPMSKKRHTLEHLRSQAHLRPRSNIHGAAMRIRDAMAYASHSFFKERGFLYIHTPLITASDAEGAGEMFQVSTMLSNNPDGVLPTTTNDDGSKKVDFSGDFFGKPSYLTVSGQLNVETHSCALSDVYTFGPTFRAENSNTTRHLAEFWMIEPEIAFADLTDDINLAEDYLKYCAQYALDNYMEDLKFFNQNVEKGLIERLQKTVAEPFIRISYTDAVELLLQPKHLKKGKFENKPTWGEDLGSEHERYLTEKVYGKPVVIYNYPKGFKAFYMRLNDDNETVAACDILVPNIGEIIGGSQREERLDVLVQRLVEMGQNPEDYQWYLDLRKYGTVPHAGFGCGFERLVRFVTGIENIRDVIPFPRWPGNADF